MKRHTKDMKLKRILSVLLALLLCVPSWPVAAATTLPDEADGTKIESVTVKWLTEDSPWTQDAQDYFDGDDQFLFLAPSGDKELVMQYQADISLSGQMDYEPGDIEIRIPAQVWHPRKYVDDGNGGVKGIVDEDQLIGSMTLSVPEAPNTSGDFNWKLVDGEYVITNVSTIGATKKIMLQFSIDGLYPHEIVDQSQSEPIHVVCEVTTAKGNQIALESDELIAQVDTFEKIDRDAAIKFGAVLQEVPYTNMSNIAWQKIGGYTNRDDYVFVLWRLDLNQYGNQPYTLSLEDVFGQVYSVDALGNRTDVTAHPILLDTNGLTTPIVQTDGFTDETVPSPVFLTDPESRYVTAYVAYPKTDFPAVLVNDELSVYYIENTSEWTLTEADAPVSDPGHGLNADSRKETKSEASATVEYMPMPFVAPGEVSIVEKYTDNGEKTQYYEYVLNRLINGESADVPYMVKMENLTWNQTSPDTYNYTADRPKTNQEMLDTNEDPDLYGTLGWRAIAEDYRRVMNNNGEQMDPADFEFSSVQLGEYTLYRYGAIPHKGSGVTRDPLDGSWHLRSVDPGTVCYYEDTTLTKPDVKVEYKLNGSGDWQTAAVLKWGTNGKGSLWFDQIASGVETDATLGVIRFPHNVSDVRYIVENTVFNGVYADRSDVAGVVLYLHPTITVLPSEKNLAIVKAAMENFDAPEIFLENDVRMYEEGWMDPTGIAHNNHLVYSDKALAVLMGIEYGAWLEKSAEYDRTKDNDVANRTATVHYTGTFIEETNISSLETYDMAVNEGALPVETKGVWYDLLPEGFTPVMSTLRTDDNDRVTGAYVIRSWKGSSRDLLVVEVETSPDPQFLPPEPGNTSSGFVSDVHHVYFDAVTGYDDIVTHGQTASNFLAYESLSELTDGILGTKSGLKGAADTPDRSVNKHTPQLTSEITDLLTGLDPESDPDDARFVYAQDYTELDVVISAVSGVSKMVREDLAGAWTQGLSGQTQATVYEGHNYTYRLELSSGKQTVTRDMYLFDTIENYHVPNDGSKEEDYRHIQDRKDWPGDWEGIGQWRGALTSVDLSEFIAAGVAPVLYVSVVNDLQFADSTPDMTQLQKDALFTSGPYDVTDTSYWTKVELDASGVWTVPANLKGLVTAIAVDASKSADGQLFELQPEEKMNAYLHMMAPDDDGDENLRHAKGAYAQSGGVIDWVAATDPANNMYAYNNTRLRCVQTDSTTSTSDLSTKTMIRNDYTRVGILPEIMNVEKIWEDDNNHDGTRPAEIVVSLNRKKAGASGDPAPVMDAQGSPVTLTLNDANEWKGQFYQIDIVDETGTPYLYTFTETLPDGSPLENGYSLSWHRDVEPNYQLFNRRENETVSINGVKFWDDNGNADDHRPSSIKVSLYCDGELIDSLQVTPDRFGQWKYDFGPRERYKPYNAATGKLEEYVYTVSEESMDYYVATIGDYASITNTYVPFGDAEIVKKVVGLSDANKDHLFEYTVVFYSDAKDKMTLYGSFPCHVEEWLNGSWVPVSGTDATVSSGDKFTLKADQKLVIEDLPTLSVVNVTESQDPVYTVMGDANQIDTVRGGQVRTFEYVNAYEAKGELDLLAGKKLTGRAMKKGEFAFSVREKDSGKDEIVSTGRVGSVTSSQNAIGEPIISTGSVEFSPIHYSVEDAGKTFTYEISEDIPAEPKPGVTYDPKSVTVTVTVEDNGDGTLKITARDADNQVISDGSEIHLYENEYEAECDVTLELKKVLEGRSLQDQEFEFELCTCDEKGENAVPLTPTVKNDGDSVVFSGYDALHFDQDDVSLNPDKQSATYYFLAREIEGSDPDVEYTAESKLFTVKVHDAGDGTLVYTVGAQKLEPNDTVCEHCGGTGEVPKVGMYSGIRFGNSSNYRISDAQRDALLASSAINLTDYTYFKRAGTLSHEDYDEYWGSGAWQDFLCDECLGFGAIGDYTHMDDITINTDGSIEPNDWIRLCPSCGGSGIDPGFVGGPNYSDSGYIMTVLPLEVTGSSYPYIGKAIVGLEPSQWDAYLFMIGGYKFWKPQTLPGLGGGGTVNINGFDYDFVDCPVCHGTGGSSGVIITGDPGTPVLTNRLKPGTLRLTKKAASDAISADETFDFVVTLMGDAIIDSVTYTSSLDASGTPSHTVAVVDHKFTVTLKKDETLSFRNLPDKTRYEITELPKSAPSPLPGYVTVSKDHETGTIATNENCNATFVNGIGPCEFTLQKAAPGVTAKAAEKTFTFDVYLEDTDYRSLAGQTVTVTPSFEDVTFGTDGYAIQPVPDAESLTLDANGHTVVTLAPGERLTFVDLPEGTRVTVRERSDTNAPGWTMPTGANASSADKLEWVCDPASGTYTNVTTRVFTNRYEAKGTLNLAARKALEGRELKAGEFTFELYRSDENGRYIGLDTNGQPYPITGTDVSAALLGTAVNTAAGDVNFDAIPLTEEGTLWYLIREQIPASADPTVVYSDETVLVRVPVVDREGKGHLDIGEVVSGVWTEGPFYTNAANVTAPDTLTNRVLPAALCVEKKITGETPSDAVLAASAFTAELSFTDAGGDAWTGNTNAQIIATNGTTLTAQGDKFVLTLAPGASLTFADLPVGLDYAVTETGTLPGWTLDPQTYTGTTVPCVTDEDIAWVTLVNEYAPKGTYTLALRKTLTDKNDQPLSLAAEQFSFVIRDASGKTVATAKNESDGTVTFDPISLTLADVGTRTLFVSEVDSGKPGYETDARVRTLTLTVTEDPTSAEGLSVTGVLSFEDGTAADADLFKNKYDPLIDIPVTKIWNDAGHTDERAEVTLTLYAVDMDSVFTLAKPSATWTGAPADLLPNPWTIDRATAQATDTQSGTWYGLPAADDLGRPYTYVVQENDVPNYLSVITGTQETGLEVTNKLIFTEIPLEITKTVDGEEPWEDEVFSFTLADETGRPIAIARNEASRVKFDDLFFTRADVGTHVYTVTENAPGKDYYEKDDSEYTLTVTVTADNNALTATPLITKNGAVVTGITFDNAYIAACDITLTGTKALNGRAVRPDDVFTFTVKEGNTVVTTGKVEGTGAITFTPIAYLAEDVGDHTYTVTENDPALPGVQKDPSVFTVKVKVSDNGDRTLKAEILKAESDEIAFENTYEAAGKLQLTGTKTMKGRALTNYDRYTFTVKEGDRTVTTGTSDVNGNVTFGEIRYTAKDAGLHTYTVTEDASAVPGVSIDPSPRTVTVKVTDNGDGTVSASLTQESMALDFVNQYTAKGYVDLLAEKYMVEEGQAPQPGEVFDFEMTDENGNTVVKQNDGSKIDFGRVEFTLADVGTHTWYFREKQRVNGDHVTDNARYRVTVTVTDTGNGTLRTEKTVTRIEPDGTETLLPPGSGVIFVNYRKSKLTVTKRWQGGDGEYPLTFYVYCNGELVQPVETVTDPETGDRVQKINYHEEQNGYVYTFSGLADYTPEGRKLTWSVKEKGLPGYLRIYMNVGAHKGESDALYDGATVINRAVTDFRVRKVWEGLADNAPRPKIELVLYCNGEETVKEPSGPDKDGWYVWKNLPETVNGQPAEYWVVELPVKGMSTRYVNVGYYDEETDRAYENGTIVNAGVPKTGDSANPVLWAVLAVLGVAGCGCALFAMKKKKK